MKKLLKRSLVVTSILSFFVLFIISIYFIVVINNTDALDLNKLTPSNSSMMYDLDETLVTNISPTINKYVNYDNISKNMIAAIISVEDDSFYNHNGVNFKRMLKATYMNIKNISFKEGASTIDQQLIKNRFLTNKKSINRKISEISLSLNLNKNYSKNQILEMYLNTVLFSKNIYGVEAASNYFFNKSASDLNINEAAILAGMVQLPNYYNPFRNPEKSQKRRDLVLHLMHKHGYISKDELNYNLNVNIKDNLHYKNNEYLEPYFQSYSDYTHNYLKEYNLDIGNEDINVFTYMNKEIQKELFDIVNNKYQHFSDENLKCAIVVLDNNTGGVLGIIGNKSSDQKVLNYATTRRQPGSTIKPILDYAPAIEYLNYNPSTLILDEPYSYSDGTKIKNWDNKFKGHITLRYALEDSRNVPALKLFQTVGKEKCKEFASRLNISTDEEIYESEALGGSTHGYSLLDMTNAYLAFANMGKFIKASPVRKIDYNETSYANNETGKMVMKPSTAYLINSMLHDVYSGTSSDLKHTYLCAKTGQTNYSKETALKYKIPLNATKESLLIAYTPDITIGIWVGYDKLSNTTYLDNAKTQIPRYIMKDVLNKFSKSNAPYKKPENIVTKDIIIENNNIYLANDIDFQKSYTEYFIKGTEPLDYYRKNNNYEI